MGIMSFYPYNKNKSEKITQMDRSGHQLSNRTLEWKIGPFLAELQLFFVLFICVLIIFTKNQSVRQS